jgi:hypothetical protein
MIRTERPESSAGVLGTIDSSAMSEVECFVLAPPRPLGGQAARAVVQSKVAVSHSSQALI